eukprot:2116342-Pyramimonas_sp.AAC.1
MRCGWAWVRLRLGVDSEYQLAAGKRGPLPGPRQSNNRAELWAFFNCVKSTNDDLHFWTDSAALVAGWRNLRHQGPFNRGSNADAWQLIHKALINRRGTISLLKIESHLTLEEALQGGCPKHAWAGNNIAYKLADQAAAGHAI